MDFLLIYTNIIRAIVIIMTAVQIYKHNYKKFVYAAITITLTFVPWLIGLINVRINTLTGFLYVTVVFMAMYLGQGYKYYDSYSWWDRCVHFLSGVLFFSFGITLAEKAPDAGLAGTLIFSLALSLALHEIWEVFEFIVDSIFHTNHQRWQENRFVMNHQPDKAIQPPGLVDTVSDAIANILGAIAALLGWWIHLTL